MRISDWSSDVCSSDLQNSLFRRALGSIASRCRTEVADFTVIQSRGQLLADVPAVWVIPDDTILSIIKCQSALLGKASDDIDLDLFSIWPPSFNEPHECAEHSGLVPSVLNNFRSEDGSVRKKR